MSPLKILLPFFVFLTVFSFGQNRVFERPDNIGHSFLMDLGEGQTLIAKEHRFGSDSTQVHLLSANSDMVLTHLGGFRMLANLTWLNDVATVDDGVIMGGANLAFTTTPYVMRMNFDGNVDFSYFFSGLEDGQDQIINTFVSDNDLDLFTWSDNTRLSYYMLNGSIDGNFPSGLRVHAPEEMEFRTDDIAPTEIDNEYIVLCQADTNNTGSRFLIVSRINPEGVLWSYMHDHVVTEGTDSEYAYGLKHLSDGNWMYLASYTDENVNNRRIVKMDGQGNVLWSKEYFLNGEKIHMYFNYEASDGGFLQNAFIPSSSETLAIKLDANGEVQWSKKYIPSQTTNSAMGLYYKNNQGQLYSYNQFALAEIDETHNSCDFEPHSGVTSSDVTFDIVAVSHNTTEIIPERGDMPYQMRAGFYENTLMCLATGIEETQGENFDIYPNPSSDVLNIDLSNFQNAVNLSVVDMQGRVVMEDKSISKKSVSLNISTLVSGVYLLRLRSDADYQSVRFVKE